jgi:hypothetical protein
VVGLVQTPPRNLTLLKPEIYDNKRKSEIAPCKKSMGSENCRAYKMKIHSLSRIASPYTKW